MLCRSSAQADHRQGGAAVAQFVSGAVDHGQDGAGGDRYQNGQTQMLRGRTGDRDGCLGRGQRRPAQTQSRPQNAGGVNVRVGGEQDQIAAGTQREAGAALRENGPLRGGVRRGQLQGRSRRRGLRGGIVADGVIGREGRARGGRGDPF